uniref:Uncharacterized protein n=1 Tax=Plectus sambesii TaxID=2011161 RepID=A0A914VDW3_9BILA
MMNSLACGIVAFLCFCCSVSSDGSNVTSLLATCSNGGCDFEFVIEQLAVEDTGTDELLTIADNVTQAMLLLRNFTSALLSSVVNADDEATTTYYLGEQKYNATMDRLNNMTVSLDRDVEKHKSAAQAIMNAALCFQSHDSNMNCGAMIPDKLT